jgi:hypothetical protein
MIIKCAVCDSDPLGRWRQPPAIIFPDPYAKGAATSERGFVYACRDCLSPQREQEIARRERERGWPKGGLR